MSDGSLNKLWRSCRRKFIGLLRHWKVLLLVGLTIVAGVFGYLFREWAHPTTPDIEASVPPLLLDLFVADRNTPLSVEVDIDRIFDSPEPTAHSQLVASLKVGTEAKNILIMSSVRDGRDHGMRGWLKEVNIPTLNNVVGSMQFSGGPGYAGVYESSAAPSIVGPSIIIAEFSLPDNMIHNGNGTFASRLPSLAFNETGQQTLPSLYVQSGFSLFDIVHLQQVVIPPAFHKPSSTNPADYGLPTGRDRHLFWEPSRLTTKVVLSNAEQYTRDARLDDNSPPDGTPFGSSFVWTGTFGLAPLISATKWSEVERRANWDFWAGLVLGLGAATALGVIQELPSTIRLPRWLRRRSKKASAGVDGIDATTTSRILAQHHARESPHP